MNKNFVRSNVTPLFPAIERHIERVRFLKSLKVMHHLSATYISCATADQLREKRLQLIEGQKLLNDPKSIAFCDRLIKALTARLHVIPTERYVRSRVDGDSLNPLR